MRREEADRMQRKFICLTKENILNYKDVAFWYAAHHYYTLTNQTIWLTKTEHSFKSFFDFNLIHQATSALQLSKRSITLMRKRFAELAVEFSSDVFAPFPFSLYEALEGALLTLPPKSRNPYMFTYLYLYFQIPHQRNTYERSITQMAVDLTTNRNQIIERLNFFIDHGFLERAGGYRFTGDTTFSYRYFIPERWKPVIFKEATSMF